MRNNKAILDEAARSVRRTFIGSVAGTLAMLAVVGAAGAYGMPEKLTAQALSAAMAKFNMKFPAEAEQRRPAVERAGDRRADIRCSVRRRVAGVRCRAGRCRSRWLLPSHAAVEPRRGSGCSVARCARGRHRRRSSRTVDMRSAPAAPIACRSTQPHRSCRSRAAAPEPAPAVTASLMPRASAGRRRGASAPFRADGVRSAEAGRCSSPHGNAEDRR